MKITKNQLQELIKEEYDKIKKIKELEAKKSQIVSQLNEMESTEGFIAEEEIEEGLFGPGKEEVEANRQVAEKALTDMFAQIEAKGLKYAGASKEKLMQQAAGDNFKQTFRFQQNKQKGSPNYGAVFIIYGSTQTGGGWGGHAFGSGS